jgi:hypothetical protein
LSRTVTTRVTEQTLGYAIFALYSFRLLLGIFIHSVRTPSLFIANHPPQNYIHAALGLTILVMAAYQVCLSHRLPLHLKGLYHLTDGK